MPLFTSRTKSFGCCVSRLGCLCCVGSVCCVRVFGFFVCFDFGFGKLRGFGVVGGICGGLSCLFVWDFAFALFSTRDFISSEPFCSFFSSKLFFFFIIIIAIRSWKFFNFFFIFFFFFFLLRTRS